MKLSWRKILNWKRKIDERDSEDQEAKALHKPSQDLSLWGMIFHYVKLILSLMNEC